MRQNNVKQKIAPAFPGLFLFSKKRDGKRHLNQQEDRDDQLKRRFVRFVAEDPHTKECSDRSSQKSNRVKNNFRHTQAFSSGLPFIKSVQKKGCNVPADHKDPRPRQCKKYSKSKRTERKAKKKKDACKKIRAMSHRVFLKPRQPPLAPP